MSNLNMNAQEGRLSQATEAPVANNMGGRVARPIETTKEAPGTEGNAQGAMDMARAQSQVVGQVNAMVQDSTAKYFNLKIAEEETKRQSHMIELTTAEKKARTESRQDAMDKGLTTEQEQALYQQKLDRNAADVGDKYQYQTKVGNDMAARVDAWKANVNADYQESVVLPRFVDNVKGNTIRSLTEWSKQVTDTVAQNGDPAKGAELMKQTTAEMKAYLSSPQMIATFGVAGVEQLKQKYIGEMQVDAVTTIANNDPEKAVAMLRNETGNPETDPLHGMDPSVRRQALYTAEKEQGTRRADEARKLKERQDATEFELSYKITTHQLSGSDAVAQIYKMRRNGEIDQGHAESLLTKVENRMERAQRAAEAGQARAERAKEKQDAVLQPVRDAMEMNLPLDPRNASHVKSVNAYAAEVLKRNPNANPIDLVTEITNKTGVAPKILTSTIYSRVMSKDPKEAAQGAQLLASLAERSPNLIHSLSDEVVTKANLIGGGMHPDQAQATLEKARTLTSEQKKVYEEKGKPFIPKLEGDVATTLGVDKKQVTPEVLGHARELFKEQLVMNGGDVNAARESTKLLIHKSYGVSNLTGKPTVMFNAPEGTNGSTKWMNDQFANDLKPLGLKPEQVRLKANTDGTYDLFAVNTQGAVTGHVVDPTTGKKLTWQPDQEAAAKIQRDAETEAAKKKREEYLKTSPNPLLNPQAVDSTSFIPKGMKGTKPVNTTEPKFGKY